MASTRVEVRGTKDVAKILDKLTGREQQNRIRRATRAGAKVLRQESRSEARGRADLPKSFAKTATKGHRNPLGTSTGPTSPLLNIFEVGAKIHGIAPRRGLLLSGGAGKRWRDKGFAASEPVRHPGMDARPLIAPVFARKQDDAGEAAMKVLTEDLEK